MAETRSFIYQTDSSNKFWTVTLDDSTVTTQWGRIGTKGQSKSFEFASETDAAADFAARVCGKLKEGYTETGLPAPQTKPTGPLPEALMLEALDLLGINAENASQDPEEHNLTSYVAYSEHSVITDWRNPVHDVLGEFETLLLRHAVRMQLNDDEPVVVSLTADQFAIRFQMPDTESGDHDLHSFVFALDSMLPTSLAIYSLAECDDSDGYAYTLLPVATWDKMKSLLGPWFSFYFAKHPALRVKKLALPKQAPRATTKKVNWQKEYDYGRFKEPHDKSEKDWLRAIEAIDPRCPTPIVGHARTQTCPYNLRVGDAFQRALNLSDNQCMKILVPSQLLEGLTSDLDRQHSNHWLFDGKTDRIATLLYEHAYATLVGTRYAFLIAHYQPKQFRPLGSGDPTWSYFVFLALGCDDEARRLGDLLMHPAAQKEERAPFEKNCEAYCDLAVFLHTGERRLDLALIEPIMVLADPAAWDDPENISQALQYHCIKRGESFTHRSRRWVWPASIYTLARRCNSRDKLPADNPFLNQWRDRSDIDWTSPVICRLQEIDKRLSQVVDPHYPPLIPIPPITVPARVDRIENGKIFGTTILQLASGFEFTVKGPVDSGKAPDVGDLWNFKMDSTGSMYVAETHPDLGPIHYEKYRLEGKWTKKVSDGSR